MNQQPEQDFNIDDSSFEQAQIGQSGGNLHQIQNTNIYSLLNLAELLRPRQVESSNRKDFNSRKILLNKVKRYWVEDLLEKSLHHKALIELGLEERLDAVERPSEIAQEDESDFRQPLPKDKSNIDVFKQMGAGRTLLILGAPGAGKTTFLLRLAKNLIADTEENLSLPIPVVFNLSPWTSKRQNIVNWLIQELNSRYKVSKSLAKSWIQNQQLLLLLDGLDEVKADSRNACVQALNQFMNNYGETEMVICSRIRDYELLSHRLSMQRGICIQPLTTEQINQYLDRAGNQLQAVKTLLQTDTTLQELVKSPLMLSIITLAYQNISVEDLPKANSVEEHRNNLFDNYIKRMFNRRKSNNLNKLYLEKQARIWLAWLAYKMSQESQTIFSIEQLQPRWLESKFQKFIYSLGLILLSSLATFLIGILLVFIVGFPLKLLNLSKSLNYALSNGLFFIILGLFWGLTSVVNSTLSNKEEIIISTQLWGWSREKATRGIVSGAKVGLIVGILLSLLISLFFFYFSIISGSGFIFTLSDNTIFSDKLKGLLISLTSGFIFALSLKILKSFFNCSTINFSVRIISLYSGIKKTLLWGIIGGILIWIISLSVPGKLMSSLINITGGFLQVCFSLCLVFGLICGIIGALISGRNSVGIQKEVVPINPLRQLLIRTGVWSVIGGLLISGVIVELKNPLLELMGEASFKQNNNIIISIIEESFTFIPIFGLSIGFACIQHFTLRFIIYKKKYIPWNFTNFLDFATERIFLQKIGSGYIFVHRLLQEHFATLHQPSQSSSIEVSLSTTRIKKVFSFFLIGTTILSVVVGYLFQEKVKEYIQGVVKYLWNQNRAIDYWSRDIRKNSKDTLSYFSYLNRAIAYSTKKDYDHAIADFTKAIEIDPRYTGTRGYMVYMNPYFYRAIAYYGKKDYDRAIADYTKLIEIDPKFTVAYLDRGNAYRDKKDYDRAIADFTKAIELDPKFTVAYLDRGNVYYDKKDYDRAITDYTKAIELDLKFTVLYLNRGNAYYFKKDYDRAIADYTKAIELDPKFTVAYNGRGNVYYDKKDYDRAIADYTKAIELDPKFTVAYNGRGNAYYFKKDYDRAIADYTKAIELDPKFTVAYLNRGNAYRDKKDYDRAIADYTKAIELDPKFTVAYNGRGYAYYFKKDYDRAIADYTKAIELDPKFTVAYNGRGYAYYDKKDYDRAITDYTKAIELDPKFTVAYNGRGYAYYFKKDYDRAIADFTKAIELDPKFTVLYLNRGYAYYDKKDYDRAIADFTKAIELDLKFTVAYLNRGNAYRDKKDYDRAIADYTKAIELDPKFTVAYNGRGYAYYFKKDYDRAIADYTKAIEIDPKFTLAYNNLQRAKTKKKNYNHH